MVSKVLIITPYFLPDSNGLSLYSKNFAFELSKTREVYVLTSENRDMLQNVKVLANVSSWNSFSLFKEIRTIRKISPDEILYQYVPFMYGRAGINFIFPVFIFLLRYVFRFRINGMFHELYYPFEMKFKSLIMYFSHIFMLFILNLSTNKIFLSTEYFLERMSHFPFFRKKNATHLPVGSNVRCYNYQFENDYSKTMKILTIGGGHPTKGLEEVVKVVKELNDEVGTKIVYSITGINKEQFNRVTAGQYADYLDDMFIPLGVLNEEELSKTISSSDFVLGYFTDGISTRRGSAIISLQHGRPLITTVTKRTENIFYENVGLHLLEISNFKNGLKKIVEGCDLEGSNRFKPLDSLINLYEYNFSWKKIVERYVS